MYTQLIVTAKYKQSLNIYEPTILNTLLVLGYNDVQAWIQ